MQWGRVYRELRRRHVFRVGVAYLVSAWLLLQLGAILFPAFGAPHWALRALFGVLAVGFVVALALTWAFEVTPKGVRRTEEADSEDARSPEEYRRAGRFLNAAIIIVLAAAVGVLAWRLYLRPGSSAAGMSAAVPANSIAVLPFVNLSPSGNEDYFAEGIAEQLLDILAQATDLKVVARTSSFQFKGKEEDVRKIGQVLDVAHVLEGSVLRDGDEVRISVQLVNTRTGFQEWSHTYQRGMGDIFKVQDAITRSIADALKAKFGSAKAGASAGVALAKADPPANPQAYDEYLLGRHLMNERTGKSLKAALVHFKNATKLDPTYAPPYAQIAIVYTLLQDDLYGEYSYVQSLRLGKPYLDRAVALAPNAPETQAALGRTASTPEEWSAHYAKALEVNPDYMDVVVWQSQALDRLGRPRDAFETLQAGARRDPLNRLVNENYVGDLIDRGRFKEAESIARRFLSVYPAWGHIFMGMAVGAQGRPAAALKNFLQALAERPGWRVALGWIGASIERAGLYNEVLRMPQGRHGVREADLAGNRAEALRQVRAFLAANPEGIGSHMAAAHFYADFRDRAKALEQLGKAQAAAEQKGQDLWDCKCWGEELEFAALLQQAGKSQEARKLVARIRKEVTAANARYESAGIELGGGYEYFVAGTDILSGKRAAGLAALQKAADRARAVHGFVSGKLYPVSLRHARQFDAVRGDPRFQAVVKQMKVQQSKIRAQILPVLCSWNYPKAGWHPQAATCAGVAKTALAATATRGL